MAGLTAAAPAVAEPPAWTLPDSAFQPGAARPGYAAMARVEYLAERLRAAPGREAVVSGSSGRCPADGAAEALARERVAAVLETLRRLGARAVAAEPLLAPCGPDQAAVRVEVRRGEASRSPLSPKLSGQLREEGAYRARRAGAWSKARTSFLPAASGRPASFLSYKIAARGRFDGAYRWTRRYPAEARRELGAELELREAYVDVDAAGLQWRVGRQFVVWGEAAGVFVADVVNAKDLREFLLPDFEQIRVPAEALLVERQGDAWHAEAVWIPLLAFDRHAPAGADFSPFPADALSVAPTRRPRDRLRDGEYGARLSLLTDGWSASVFHLDAWDRAPALLRSLDPLGARYYPEHRRSPVSGATLSQDVSGTVISLEALYGHRRLLSVLDTRDLDGVVRRDTVDWMAGATRRIGRCDFAVQYLERRVLACADCALRGEEPWRRMGSFGVKTWVLSERLEPEFFLVAGLARRDLLIRPRLTWTLSDGVQARLGWDGLDGREDGFFGRFAADSRAWAELRWSFAGPAS